MDPASYIATPLCPGEFLNTAWALFFVSLLPAARLAESTSLPTLESKQEMVAQWKLAFCLTLSPGDHNKDIFVTAASSPLTFSLNLKK